MPKEIAFKIITPEREVYSDYVTQVTLSTKDGQITILPNHIPLVSVLVPGEVLIKKDSVEIPLVVSGGFVQVEHNNVTILADTAERVEEIDIARAEEARKRAQKRLDEAKVLSAEEFAYLSSKIEKELARLRVKRKYKDVGKSVGG